MATITTPESRGRIAYTAYCKSLVLQGQRTWDQLPPFDRLVLHDRDAWMRAADVLWTLATTGGFEL